MFIKVTRKDQCRNQKAEVESTYIIYLKSLRNKFTLHGAGNGSECDNYAPNSSPFSL